MTPEDAAQQHADQDRWLSNALQVSQAEIAMRRDLYVRAFLAGWHAALAAALAAAPASSPPRDEQHEEKDLARWGTRSNATVRATASTDREEP